MKCPNLIKCLDEMIVNEILNPTNATLFYLDGILFDSKPIIEACETIIQFNIEKILDDTSCVEQLSSLPFKRMHSLCKDDKLHVRNE